MSEISNPTCRALVALAFALTAGGASAQTPTDGVQGFIGMGLTVGGDKIFTANYVNGDTEDINAGELFQLGAGVQWNASHSPLALAFSLNYHGDIANASNGKADFKRYPLEAIAYYRSSDALRFGLGVRYVMSPIASFEVDGGSDEELEFDDTVGAVAEIGYGFTPNFWLSLRAVSEKYQPKTYRLNGVTIDVGNAEKLDGTHFGVNVVYLF